MREKLIIIIESYSQDELTTNDWIEIAIESEEELLKRIQDILEYYVNEYHAS